jgi:tripartite-type tricarboxylate transporter receptor subunit TctC
MEGRMKRALLAAVAMLAVASFGAKAQDFPTRPITLVVPLSAGGTADLECRLAADRASRLLGQQIVVDNRAGGAGGRVGTEFVLRATPDGYTLLCAPSLTFSTTHLLFARSAFDTRKMEPVSVLATYPLVMLARAGFPADNMKDLIAYGRANPGKINYGNQGKGQTGDLLGKLLAMKGNFQMAEIPYRGSAPAINDLLAGNIDVMADYLLANKQNIDAGKLKFLAVGSTERLKDYPNVETLAETFPGLVADTWMGIAAPPGTPKEIVAKLSNAIGKGFQEPDVQERIRGLQATPFGSTPEQMRDLIQKSLEQWGPVIEAAHISLDD